MYNRIITAATNVAQALNFDYNQTRKLCSQLKSYKDRAEPFHRDFEYGDDAINWWESIELIPNVLQEVALYILSISPNSASCERGFSTLGWLTGKRRLRLGVERLESIAKLISYYRSNAPKELYYFGKQNGQLCISDSEVMRVVRSALAEPVEYEEYEEDDDSEPASENMRRTITGEPIPEDNVLVVIERNLWLDNMLNLNHRNIIESLGEVPVDDDDEDGEDGEDGEGNEAEKDNDEGVGRRDFTTEDILAEFGEN